MTVAKKPTPIKATSKSVEALKHDEARRKNIPSAEYQSVIQMNEQTPVRVAYPRDAAGLDNEKQQRNRDLDPQLVWRGKDEQDWSDLVVHAPPLYIQEKVNVATVVMRTTMFPCVAVPPLWHDDAEQARVFGV